MTTISRNLEKHGIEVSFDSKPVQTIIDTLKAAGFRWHRAGGYWYAKENAETLAAAQSVAGNENFVESCNQPKTARPALAPLWDRVKFTPGTCPDECSARTVGSNYRSGLSVKEIAAIVRKHLKERFPECKFSVTSKHDSINCYLMAAPYAKCTETKDSFGDWLTRQQVDDLQPEIAAIIDYARAYLNSYDYNDSDPYTDYFSRNFYGWVALGDYIQTEATEAQQADIAAFRAAIENENLEKLEKQEQELAKWREERAQAEAEAEKRNAERAALVAAVEAEAVVVDLPEDEQYTLENLKELRKVCSIDEAHEAWKETEQDYAERGLIAPRCFAVVERTVTLSAKAWDIFKENLMEDWSFVAGRGGSRTYDPRCATDEDWNRMTNDERQSVRWYALAVAILDEAGNLLCAIDPQGHTYCRYTLLTDEAVRAPMPNIAPDESPEAVKAAYIEDVSTEIIMENNLNENWQESEIYEQKMAEHLEGLTVDIIRRIELESLKKWLYAWLDRYNTIQQRIARANIQQGEQITIVRYAWFGELEAVKGTVNFVKPCEYAQCKDAVAIELQQGKKISMNYLHSGHSWFIVRGSVSIPESVYWKQLDDHTRMTKYSAFDRQSIIAAQEYANQHGYDIIASNIV